MTKDTEDTELNWAYLAGIIDGEGSFGVYSAGTRLSVSNTHLPLLEWILAFTDTGRIFAVQSKKSVQQCYQWDCAARAIRIILPRVIPYMRVKRVKAELFVEYLSGINPNSASPITPEEHARRERLIAAMKETMRGRDWDSRLVRAGNEKGF